MSWKDRDAEVADLKEIHQALDDEAAAALDAFEAGEWGRKFPAIAQNRRRAWDEVVPVFAFPKEVR